jgi:hypothetical protein
LRRMKRWRASWSIAASRVNHTRGSQIHLGLDAGASTLEAGVQAGGG